MAMEQIKEDRGCNTAAIRIVRIFPKVFLGDFQKGHQKRLTENTQQ